MVKKRHSQAYIALVGEITDATVLGNAVNYLTTSQLPNGSWNDDPYSTALAIRALYLSESKPPPPLEPTTGTVTGTVVDASTNQPLEGVSVVSGQLSATTTATGDFTLSDIPEGSQTIEFSLTGYTTATVTVDIVAGSITDIGTIPLSTDPTTGIIKGIVTDAGTGQPIEGVTITVTGSFSGSTTTGTEGGFIFTNITPGSVTITAEKAGYYSVTGTGEVVAGGILFFNPTLSTTTPEPITGIIKGTVTDADTAQPIEGVTITVTGSFSGSTITDTDGSFIITNVTPGSVTITAEKTGYYTVAGTGEIVAGGILFFNPQLSTQPPPPTTGNLTGRVFDSSTNEPIQGATISLTDKISTSTDTQGVFLIEDITPDTYEVAITASGYISQSYQVIIIAGVTTDMQTIYLTPSPTSTTITGTVTDASTGEPIANADVAVIGTELSTKTDFDGTYTISGITLLEFTIKASATGYDSLTYSISTTAYGEYTVDFELTPSQVSDLRITSLSTDKQSYQANENVIITATIENQADTEAQGIVMAEIQDVGGNVIALVSSTEPDITLAPSESIQAEIQWNTGQFSPAEYLITLMVTDPETVSRQNPTGDVLAERAVSVTITPTPAIRGSIALSPPVTQADMQIPVEITAAIRNTGNIPITTTLTLEASLNETTVYSAEAAITGLQVNNIQEIGFGSFIPQEGGNYLITLKPADETITSDISTVLYVGPHATATFTVTPDKAFPGDVKIKGNIHITGIKAATGTTHDPLVPLIKDAIQRGVNYEQPAVMTWHNTKKCYGCHVQSQALYGLEISSAKATIDSSVTQTLFNAFKGWQKPNGSVTSSPYIYSYVNTQTQLALWAYTSWHDENEATPYILKSADYLLSKQSSDGSWTCDHCSGWWGSRTSATAITVIGISKAYSLSKDTKYLTSLTKAVQYLLTPNLVSNTNNMLMAHQVIGLEAALSVITEPTLREQITNVINTAISQMKTSQRADGGWGRYTSNVSDSLVTAKVLYAMAKADVSKEDTALRNATVFLLNNQAPDGSWYSQNGILNTRLATTTWVIISLPIAFERIGGIDTDIYLTFPDDVALNSSNPIPTDSSDGNYHWKLLGVMEEGKDIALDLILNSLLPGETRKVAASAELTFTNTYTGETITIPIEIPTVTGISPVSIDVTTDKEEYTANEDVDITTTITNISPQAMDMTARITIEDTEGDIVAEVAEFQVDNLSPFSTQTFTFTWNTGTTLSGDYLVRAELYEDGIFLTEDTANFTILPEKTVTSKVTTDKTQYNPNQTVTITSTIQSTSPNYIFENLVAEVSVVSSQGETLYTETNTIPILTPNQLTETKTYWNTSQNPKGTYTVNLEVLEGTTTLSTSQTTFEIPGTSQTGEGITGTITASPDPGYQRKQETITYTITNNGNEDIDNLTAKVLIVDPDTQETKTEFSSQYPLNKEETITEIRTISTLNLSPKIYLAILQASTSSMPEPRTLASTTFEVKPGIEVTKTIPDVTNLLVWVNEKCEGGRRQEAKDRRQEKHYRDSEQKKCTDEKRLRLDLLKDILTEASTSYHIVYDKKDFQRELRNPYYTDFLIIGNHHPLEDHYYKELREQIYSGKGLISILRVKHGEHHREDYDPLFGIRFKGYLSGDEHEIELLDSPISEAGTLEAKGKAIKVEAKEDTIIAGWTSKTEHRRQDTGYKDEEAKYPAIILNEYGNGRTIFYAFDLGKSITEQNLKQLSELIKNSITYIHKPIDTNTLYPYQMIPVEIKLRSLGAAFDLRITETYPVELKLLDPTTGQWITQNPWQTELHLEPDETKSILYYALTPDKTGTYTLQTEVEYLEEGDYKFYQSLNLDIIIDRDIATITNNILDTLKNLSVSDRDRQKLDNAIRYIQNTQDREPATKEDTDKNIHDILKAIDSLVSITSADIAEARLLVDGLLRIWEERSYYGVAGTR